MSKHTGHGKGTLAKHKLLHAMVSTRLQSTKNLKFINKYRLIDAFCGEGMYDELRGSPFIIGDSVIHAKYPKNKKDIMKPITCIFNDLSKSKIDRLKRNINTSGAIVCKQLKIRTFTNSFKTKYCNEEASTLLSKLKKKKSGIHTICFIDPNGAVDLPVEEIKRLSTFNNVDLIINLNTMAHKRTFHYYLATDPLNKNDLLSKMRMEDGHTDIEIHHLVEMLFTNTRDVYITYETMGHYQFVMVARFAGSRIPNFGPNFSVVRYSEFKEQLYIKKEA